MLIIYPRYMNRETKLVIKKAHDLSIHKADENDISGEKGIAGPVI